LAAFFGLLFSGLLGSLKRSETTLMFSKDKHENPSQEKGIEKESKSKVKLIVKNTICLL
jgi:hypothetical protein